MTSRVDNQGSPAWPSFATTHWSRVLSAQGESTEAAEALRALCEAYYAPVEAFVKHWSGGGDDARDLVHEFFALVLRGRALDGAVPGRGRFRSYLLGAVKHFLADRRDHARALKRGGGRPTLSLADAGVSSSSTDARGSAEDGDNEAGLEPVDPRGFPPDAYFDRQWAMHLLQRVLATLESAHDAEDKRDQFMALRPWLLGDAALTLAEAAARLGASEGAAKVAIHRLRKRFRALVRQEIAATVSDEREAAAELDYLIQALGQSGPATAPPAP